MALINKALYSFPLIIASSFGIGYYHSSANTTDPIPELECSYNSKFQQCVSANRNGNPRSIEDFPCIASESYSSILDQIILDEKFSEIQEKSEAFIESLEQDKKAIVTNPNEVIDDIMNNFGDEGVYYKEYSQLCNGGILKEKATCGPPIPLEPAGKRIAQWGLNGECMSLAKVHLNVATLTAFEIAKINKSEIVGDKHKKYVQQERKKYNQVLSTMGQILGHTERVNPTHYTANPR